MSGPLPMTPSLGRKLYGRHGWNRSTWKRHQNKRECVRRVVQAFKGQLSGGRSNPNFISPQLEETVNDLRLKALGLHPAGKTLVIRREDA
jgi:hypothetical protein